MGLNAVCVKSKKVTSTTNLKRSATSADAGGADRQRQRPVNDNVVTVSTADKPSTTARPPRTRHPALQTSSTGRSTPDLRAGPSSTRAGRHTPAVHGRRVSAVDGRGRGGLRAGGTDRGSDSDSRRRDERVRFAADTVVQTGDGRTIIDSAERRTASSKRPVSGGTLPARLHGPAAAARRAITADLDQRDVVDTRIGHKSAPRGGHARPRSAVFDDVDPRAGGSSLAARTASVPQSMNVIHRGSASSRTPREVGVATPRRVVDHRDQTTTRYRR